MPSLEKMMKSPDATASGREIGRTHFGQVLLALAGDSSQYLIGLAVMGAANMILLPLYTRYLSPSDFGRYALVEVLALGLISVSNLGVSVSYLKWFAESDRDRALVLLGTMLVVNGGAALAAGLGLWLFAASGSSARPLGGDASTFASLLLPLVFLETLQSAFLAHLRARRNAFAFCLTSGIRLVAIAVFSVWLVAGRSEGLHGVFAGRVLGDICGLLAMAAYSAPDLRARFSPRIAYAMTAYGLPVMGGSLLTMALDGSGRFFLSHYSNLAQVGLFAVATKISGVMRLLVVAPFVTAWGGLIFQIAQKPDARLIYSKIMSYVLVLSVAIALAFSLLSPFFLRLLATKEYSESLSVVPWLFLVQAVMILQHPYSVGIYLASATKCLLPVYAAGIAVNLILNRILAPRYGMLGVAWAWLAAWIVITILMSCIAQYYYAVRYEYKPLIISLGLCGLVFLGLSAQPEFSRAQGLILPSILSALIVVCAAVYLYLDVRRTRTEFGTGGSD
jgi:O-antigen/teichoic acid export membrane protein